MDGAALVAACTVRRLYCSRCRDRAALRVVWAGELCCSCVDNEVELKHAGDELELHIMSVVAGVKVHANLCHAKLLVGMWGCQSTCYS